MPESLCILGILVDKRTESVLRMQDILTKHGDMILSRVGIHDPDEKQNGLITLSVREDMGRVKELETELCKLDGVHAKTMVMKQ